MKLKWLRINIYTLIASMLISLVYAAFFYLFFIQTPILARRECAIAGLVWLGLFSLIFLLLKRFLIPTINKYSVWGKILWLLLSASLGLVFVFTNKIPNFYYVFHRHSLRIDIIQADGPHPNSREITLRWLTSEFGDIGFSNLNKEGDWLIDKNGVSHKGPTTAGITWEGRTGLSTRIDFLILDRPDEVQVSWDGVKIFPDQQNDNPAITIYKYDFKPRIVEVATSLFICWICYSLLFLVSTLFLVQVPVKRTLKDNPILEKIEKAIDPPIKTVFSSTNNGFWQKKDWSILILFFVYTLLFFLGRWNGLTPFTGLGIDASYITSYAASLDHPASFMKDPMFHDPRNFSYYVGIYIPIVRFLAGVFGDYGTGFLVLLIPLLFTQLAGFYFFGRILFRNRYFSLLLAICSTFLIPTQAWDYWGIFIDPQPRMMFQALLPWGLTLTLISLDRPGFRWLVFILLGFMIYVHPISVPPIIFSIWLGYLIFKPVGISWSRHILNQFGYMLIFLLFTIPFFIQYLGGRDIASPTTVDYETAIAFLKDTYPFSFENWRTFTDFLHGMSLTGLLTLTYFAAIIIFRSPQNRHKQALILVWITGILVATIGFSSLESFVEARLRILPIFFDVIRGLRYLVPLMEVIVFWSLAVLWDDSLMSRRFINLKQSSLTIAGLLIAITLNINFSVEAKDFMANYNFWSVNCHFQGHVACLDQESLDRNELLLIITEHTRYDDGIIIIPPAHIGGAIRYSANRSVVFDSYDSNRMALSDIKAALKQLEIEAEWNQISHEDSQTQLKGYLDLATKLGADFAVVQSPIPPWLENRLVFSNSSYSLVSLR